MRHPTSIALGAGLVLFAAEAAAHIRLDAPARRADVVGNISNDGPCGLAGAMRSATPTMLQGGQELTVEWTETQNHPSRFRIALSLDGDEFPVPSSDQEDDDCSPDEDAWCIVDGIPDPVGQTTHSYTITVPNVDCDNCTLQLVQRTSFGGPDSVFYYQCADIVIVAQDTGEPPTGGMGGASSGGTTGGADPTGPGSGTGGQAAGADTDPGNASQQKGGTSGSGGGCSLALGSPASASWALWLGPLGWAARRRRPKA